MFSKTDDLRIQGLRPLISPALLMEEFMPSEATMETVIAARAKAANIVAGKDDRLLVVVGPCSIHDPDAAIEYARKLKPYYDKLSDDLAIIMRIYFEKPRTSVGWKGLINDPDLNSSFNINKGLKMSRKLLLALAEMGLPAGCEFLDTIVPQYISDLVSWGAIGARTTESQIHRELASGLSMPIGFKNGTRGNVQIAIDAICAARHPHHFLSVTKQGIAAIVSTTGNEACHVILRGASSGPNYSHEHIQAAVESLAKANVATKLMIDCSHGNSNKDYLRQKDVAEDVCQQLIHNERAICGVMIESNLIAGNQKLASVDELTYGQSVTDACIDWEDTVVLLEKFAAAVRERRKAGGV